MPHGKNMDNCEKILQLVRKNRTGVSIKKIASALKIDDGTVYRHIAEMQNQIRLDRGIAFLIDQKQPFRKPSLVEAAERYYQFRGSREGGGVRIYKAMFGNLPEEKPKES